MAFASDATSAKTRVLSMCLSSSLGSHRHKKGHVLSPGFLRGLWAWAPSALPLLDHHFLVRGQRDQREVLAVEVIHQVEDAREAGAGVPGLVPGAILFLGFQNVGDAFCDRFA